MTMSLVTAKQLIQAARRGDVAATGKVLDAIADGTLTLYIGGTAVTASAAEVNKLTGTGAIVASGAAAAHIADPTGGATTDAEARTAINAILVVLETFNQTATS